MNAVTDDAMIEGGAAAAPLQPFGAGRAQERRPWLTAGCERLLRRIAARRGSAAEPAPLPRVPRRLLVVKVHGMGDGVMIRALLEHLRRRHPETEIGILAGAATREIMSTGTGFRIHSYRQKGLSLGAILRTAGEIRRCRYEAVLNLEQGSLAGTAFLRALGIPVRIGFLPLHDGTKAAFLTKSLRFREADSMWLSFVRAIRLVDPGFPEAPLPLPLPLGEGSWRFVRAWLEERIGAGDLAGARRVVLHLGSGPGQPFRRWPLAQFVALAERIRAECPSVTVILTGTAPEKPLVGAFLSQYGGPAIDATALGAIERTAALLASSDLLVSNDTGVMHLGAAMGTPTVGIFGPESPARWGPVGPRAVSVSATGVPCSPCSNIFRLQAPAACGNPDHIRCLRDVGVADVLAAARKVVVDGWLGEPLGEPHRSAPAASRAPA